jgi:hypothetical protein
VIGQTLFAVNIDTQTKVWSLQTLGQLQAYLPVPATMIDNRNLLFVGDGTPFGYNVTLGSSTPTQEFAAFNDEAFSGTIKFDYLDTFVLWIVIGTNQFRSSLSNSGPPFDPTYIAAKTSYPDNLQTLIVNNTEMLLLGKKKSEIWYDAGNPLFPFAKLPGSYIEHGCVAPFSAASTDISVFWLGQDLQGQGVVFRRRGYETTRISNHAIEFQLRQIYNQGGSISDAIGFTFQFDGHSFYFLTFPSGDQTWVFDDSIQDPLLAWHQEAWTDPATGLMHRHRANCFAYVGFQTGCLPGLESGQLVMGDWENGTIYAVDPDVYTDTLAPAASAGPISFVRTFPHLMIGLDPTGKPVSGEGHMIRHKKFQCDLEVGMAQTNTKISLRWSDTRGRSWGNALLQSSGELGEYTTRPFWQNLGQAMDRVYEVEYSIPAPAALVGGWVDGEVLTK